MSLASVQLGAGPDLVLLHGWGMNSAVWEPLAMELQGRFRCTLIDLPGHGRSPWRGEAQLGDWAAACLDAAPPGALWVAWSLGVLVALGAAAESPGKLRGLLAVAGTPRFAQAPDWPHAMARDTLEQFTSGLAEDHQAILERFLALQARGSDAARETLRRLKELMRERPAPQPRALEVGLQLLIGSDLRAAAASLRWPSRWLLGDRDALVPGTLAAQLRSLIPRAGVELVHGAGHAPFLSHPAVFLAALERLGEDLDSWLV